MMFERSIFFLVLTPPTNNNNNSKFSLWIDVKLLCANCVYVTLHWREIIIIVMVIINLSILLFCYANSTHFLIKNTFTRAIAPKSDDGRILNWQFTGNKRNFIGLFFFQGKIGINYHEFFATLFMEQLDFLNQRQQMTQITHVIWCNSQKNKCVMNGR